MTLLRRLQLAPNRSHLLLGPRRVGKSTYLRAAFPDAEWIDLLDTDKYYEYARRPALLHERFATRPRTIVIDEVQRVPDLLFEVHRLIEGTKNRFVLCGSSARKLRQQGVTNLAGRLRSAQLYPLTAAEIPAYDLMERLQWGCLPPVVFSDDPQQDLRDYGGEYLREEVVAEGLVRNLQAFANFLETAALSNAQVISFASVARDCGVSTKTAQEYFQILEDTLVGTLLQPWTRAKKRRSMLAPKFYYFDCGLVNTLLRRTLAPTGPEVGTAFEQFIVLETLAARGYDKRFEKVRFWRAYGGYEVDLLLDDHTAIEIKAGRVRPEELKGLRALREELKLKRMWVVSRERHRRTLEGGIEVLPWREYLEALAQL